MYARYIQQIRKLCTKKKHSVVYRFIMITSCRIMLHMQYLLNLNGLPVKNISKYPEFLYGFLFILIYKQIN